MTFDAVIIGAGPAGMAAAVYLARQKLNFVVLTGDVGGKALLSADVENYLGFHLLDGLELAKRFRAHLDDYRETFLLREGEPAMSVAREGADVRVTTERGSYLAKAVLIATGEENRRLNVPGEAEAYGRGLSYCATCDAPLFAGKDVHVVGGGNSAMDAALFLRKYASSVTVVTINAELMGDEGMRRACLAEPKIRVRPKTRTTRILLDAFVNGIGLQTDGEPERVEPSRGVFVEIGLVPTSGFAGSVAKNRVGEIVVDRQNRTSVAGIFAAGDVTDVSAKQIAVAVGEGSKAALELIRYLQTTYVDGRQG